MLAYSINALRWCARYLISSGPETERTESSGTRFWELESDRSRCGGWLSLWYD